MSTPSHQILLREVIKRLERTFSLELRETTRDWMFRRRHILLEQLLKSQLKHYERE